MNSPGPRRSRSRRAIANGVEYDGHGRDVEEADAPAGAGLDIQSRAFGDRTGVRAGHGFALPLPDGRFGHAVFLGVNRQGYLLLDISALIRVQPANPDAVREAPRRYRQPILVWHTGFAAMPLPSTAQVAPLPCEVAFRSGVGWPDPEAIARLERRFAVWNTETRQGWTALLMAMATAGERLPGIEGHTLVTARVGRDGQGCDEGSGDLTCAGECCRPAEPPACRLTDGTGGGHRASLPLKHQRCRQSLGNTVRGALRRGLYRQDDRQSEEVPHWRGFTGDQRGMHLSGSIEDYRALRGRRSTAPALRFRRSDQLASYRHRTSQVLVRN